MALNKSAPVVKPDNVSSTTSWAPKGPLEWLPHAIKQTSGGPLEWLPHGPLEWLPHGPHQTPGGPLEWLPHAVRQVPNGPLEWLPHGPLEWLPHGQHLNSAMGGPLEWLPHGPLEWLPHGPLEWLPHAQDQASKGPLEWLPHAVKQTPGGPLEWLPHGPLEWLPHGPHQAPGGPLEWLPHAVKQTPGGPLEWLPHGPLEWLPHGPNQTPGGPLEWLPHGPLEWLPHGPLEWLPHGPLEWLPHGPLGSRGKSQDTSGFLVTDKDGNGHLPTRKDGKPDHGLMGAAWAALHDGYRGNKYEGPNSGEALAKLKKLYTSEGMDTPKSAIDYMAIKSIGQDRVGSYAVLWGSETLKDLTGEYFDRDTKELTTIFDTVKRLPFIYHHALDETVKTRVLGIVDTLQPDSIGLWYEAQLKMADDYDQFVLELLQNDKLKTSSQTFPAARRVAKSGHIDRWPIIEITATPAPAEHRMPPIEFIKSAYQGMGLSIDGLLSRYTAEQAQGAAKARAELAIKRLRLLSI